MKRFVFFICFCLLLSTQSGIAQQILFRHYGVTDGLPSSTVRAIQQDRRGYLWFGTKNGLSRFDGYSFKNFQYNNNDAAALGNNFIHCIAEFDSTHLWIGTENGIYILDLETEKFSSFKPLNGKTVFDVLRDNNGMIWIASRLDGLYRFNPLTTHTINFKAGNGNRSVSANQITRLAQDKEGNIWIGTFGFGIDLYNQATGVFSNLNTANSGIGNNFINTIFRGIDGIMWVGTMNGGLGKWDPQLKKFNSYRYNVADPNSIKDNIIRAIHQTEKNKLYVGTEKGLNTLDVATGKFTAYINQSNNPFSISDNAVYAVFADRNKTVWLGTFFGGVNYVNETGSAFELFYPTGDSRSIGGKAVSSFLEDEPGRFWVGTEDGGLHYFNSVTKAIQHYPFKSGQQQLSYHNIHALQKDKDGNIWIGVFAGGVNVLNSTTGRVRYFTQQSDNANSLNSNNVFCLYYDKDAVLWAGTDKGLNKFDTATQMFRRVEQEDVVNTIVYDLCEDNSKTIWIATYNNGLISYNKKNGSWGKITTTHPTAALASNKLTCLLDDHGGNLWIGSDGGGLHKYYFAKRTMKLYNSQNGLSANVIYGVQRDDEGLIWATTNNGIYSIDAITEKIKHYTKQDNLQGQQFNYKAFYKAADGMLLAGGIQGFNTFYPERLSREENSNEVSFTKFQLFNKDVSLAVKGSPLTKQINYTNKLVLAHDQSVMSFEFAAINTAVPEKILYAYKMEGFDPDWNYVGTERKATYTNLPPGTYSFKVKATLDESNWNVPEKSIKIVIKPPFYKTPFAYLIYVLLLAGIIYTAYKYSSAYLQRQNQLKVERMKNKEEQEFYARKIEFFTVMAHEIRTPLSLIMAPLEKLITLNKWNKAETEQLHVMEENAERLMDLVNQLLDFRRIESDAYKIKKENVEIVSLVQAVYSRFSALPYQKNIEFTLTTKISSLRMDADPEVVHKILSNLLINAFKFARKKIKIVVEVANHSPSESPCLHVKIEDDGIGIPSENLQHIFKKFFTSSSGSYQYHNLGSSGIGLALASSLAEKHGGNLLVESSQGIKTTFTLELPLENKNETAFIITEKSDGNDIEEGIATVLVVDDDSSLLNFIAGSLKAERYKVVSAVNGKEALAVVENQAVDIVLSDLMMPVMNGIEFCKEVKSNVQFSHLPFILLTAKSNSESEIEAVESGADAYITKPFKWKHVVAVLKNLLESREKLRKRFSEQPSTEADVLTTNHHDKEFIEKVVQIISQRMVDPQLSVEELGRELAMSRSNLHRKLKSMSGMAPNELIRLVRLKQAAKLLVEQNYNISEVAYMTGFSSPSYFSKCFLQQFKLSPKAYTESIVKKNSPDPGDLLK